MSLLAANTYGTDIVDPLLSNPDTFQGFSISIDNWVVFIIVFLISIALVFLARKLIRSTFQKSAYYDHAIFQVRLPKDKPKDQDKEWTVQQLHEELAVGETIFSAIGGARGQRGLKAWWLGRNDHYSFELVAYKKQICFFMAAPRQMAKYIEQQVSAHYPDAAIEEVPDYNIFTPDGIVECGYLKTTRNSIFPIKTYKKIDVDPLNSVVNIMSKLNYSDGLAIQVTVRSAYGSWHRKSREVVTNVHKGKTIKEAMRISWYDKTWQFLIDLAKAAKPAPENKEPEKFNKLSAMEDEVVKNIEEKNSKAGLDVNIRIVINSADKATANLYLDNIGNAFSQYNYYEFGNSFPNRIAKKNPKKIINDFIYRRFAENIRFLLNTEELASIFHLPLRWTETPNIQWLMAKHAPAPTNVPDEGIILGTNIFRGVKKDIRIKRADRRRHTYIIGKSGVGKSVLLANMAIQDVLAGEGVGIIDPHGDLIDDVLKRIPPERAEDVILFSPSDVERPMGLNLLEFDPRFPEQKTFVINEMIKIFDKLYDLKQTGGPIFEQYMRNAMLLVMSDPESGSTLMEIPKVLADAEFRQMKLRRCADPTVVDFWRKEAEKAGGDAALANVVPYVTSKLTTFISNDMMRPIIAQQNSAFNFKDIMDTKKIFLVNLPKGIVGEINAYLLGMIIVGKILMAALARASMSRDDRKDFYLYIDEFQNFTTDSINQILSEARKYNLNLIIAHQYIGQLVKGQDTSIKDAVFGNVGTISTFKIGTDDSQVLVKEFMPVFNEYDLINIEKYTAYVKLLVDNAAVRPFSMHTPWPLIGQENPELAQKIKALSRLKYGQDRHIVEAEIMRRTKLL
jgi:hypothetical protein